jgi:hypothetical protein
MQFPSMSLRESRNPRALPSGHLEDGESVLSAATFGCGKNSWG